MDRRTMLKVAGAGAAIAAGGGSGTTAIPAPVHQDNFIVWSLEQGRPTSAQAQFARENGGAWLYVIPKAENLAEAEQAVRDGNLEYIGSLWATFRRKRSLKEAMN